MDLELLRERLRPVFARFGVSCCYFFGSRAGKDYYPTSDLDLAVLFAPRSPEADLEAEIALAQAVSEALAPLGLKVDLVSLQRAPIYLKFAAVSTGKVIYCTDEEFRTDFEEAVVRDYLDFKPFLDAYYREMVEDLLSREDQA